MTHDNSSFDAAIRAHDEALAACGLDVWVGAEPTFTNRRSESAEWLTDALGETKQTYACRMVARLRDSHPGSLVLRTLGRQYAGEDRPRWSLGLYRRRDAGPLAEGLPPDPLGGDCCCDAQCLTAFWQALTAALGRDGWAATGFQVDADMGLRVLFRCDGQQPAADPKWRQDPRNRGRGPHRVSDAAA